MQRIPQGRPTSRAGALVVLLILETLQLAAVAGAQEPSGAAAEEVGVRLENLERQRALHRQYRAALESKDWSGATRALVRASKLLFLVPRPFTSDADPGAGLRKRARELRRKFESEAWQKLQKARAAGGERAAPEGLLEFLDQEVRAAYRGEDLSRVLAELLKATAKRETERYVGTYKWGRRLRHLLPHFPCLPSRLPGSLKKTLKEEWKAASMTARRDFLRNALLEARAFADRISFLDVGEKPSIALATKNVREVDADLLQLAPEEFTQGFVTTTVTWAAPADQEAPYPFFFKAVLPLEEIDRHLLVAYVYGPGDQAAFVDAGRMKIAPHLSRWARQYPTRALWKVIPRLKPGTAVTVSGRVLRHTGGAPTHVLEVWKLEGVR